MLAAALDRPPVLLRLDLPADVEANFASDRVVRAGGQPAVVSGAVARAQALHFPTVPGADGHARQAQAWFDPPGLPGLVPRAGEQRPLMVLLHGGPTSPIAHRKPGRPTTRRCSSGPRVAMLWWTRTMAGPQATTEPTANACAASGASSTCRTPSLQ